MKAWSYLFVGVWAALLSGPSILFDFVQDDRLLIVENPDLEGWNGVKKALTEDYFSRTGFEGRVGYYRPLTRLSFVIDHAIWGLSPFGFHLTNVILGVIGVLFSLKLNSLLLSRPYALLAALAFAAHPGRSQAICVVTARSDLIATTWGILAAIVWLGYRRRCAYVSILLFLALLGKESALAMVPLLAYSSATGVAAAPSWRLRSTWLLLLIPIVAYCSLRALCGVNTPPLPTRGVLQAGTEAGRVLAYYLRALLLPLRADFAPLLPPPNRLWLLFNLIFLVLMTPSSWGLAGTARFGFAWCLFSISPLLLPSSISNPSVQGYLAPSPRFLFLASFGASLLWVSIADRMKKRLTNHRVPPLLLVGWILVLASQSLISMRYLGNEDRITRAVLAERMRIPPRQRTPAFEAELWAYRSNVHLRDGQYDSAAIAEKKVIDLDPDALHAHVGLAIAWHRAGHDSLAVPWLQSVLSPRDVDRWRRDDFHRNYVTAVGLLATMLSSAGRQEEALWWMESLTSMLPHSWKAHAALSRIRMASGDTVGAREALSRAIGLAPSGALAEHAPQP